MESGKFFTTYVWNGTIYKRASRWQRSPFVYTHYLLIFFSSQERFHPGGQYLIQFDWWLVAPWGFDVANPLRMIWNCTHIALLYISIWNVQPRWSAGTDFGVSFLLCNVATVRGRIYRCSWMKAHRDRSVIALNCVKLGCDDRTGSYSHSYHWLYAHSSEKLTLAAP